MTCRADETDVPRGFSEPSDAGKAITEMHRENHAENRALQSLPRFIIFFHRQMSCLLLYQQCDSCFPMLRLPVRIMSYIGG